VPYALTYTLAKRVPKGFFGCPHRRTHIGLIICAVAYHCKDTIDLFPLVDNEILRKVISQVKPCTCLLDLIQRPSSKQFLIANLKKCKLLLMTPCSQVLSHCTKKGNLDSSALSKFQPNSIYVPITSKTYSKPISLTYLLR
jgi:hypothetical protein